MIVGSESVEKESNRYVVSSEIVMVASSVNIFSVVFEPKANRLIHFLNRCIEFSGDSLAAYKPNCVHVLFFDVHAAGVTILGSVRVASDHIHL